MLKFSNGRWRCTKCLKVAYPTEEAATNAAVKISERMASTPGEEKRMRPYFKEQCGWWHLTRRNGRAWYEARMTPQVIKLRDYQEATIQHIYGYFRDHPGNPLAALPTGTGKSIIIAEFVHRALTQYPGTRIMVLTHVKELIKQNFDNLLSIWPTAPAGINSSGLKRRDYKEPVIFAGIQSVYKDADSWGHIDMLIIDEAHLVSNKGSTMYQQLIAGLKAKNPRLKVIGFTATAYRLGLGMLTEGEMFDDMAFDLTGRNAFNWLIAQGWISPLIPKQTQEMLDVSGLPMSGGEFKLRQLQERVDHEEITIRALNETIRLAADREHWLVFASGLKHAEHISEFLESQHNVAASYVHSKISSQERDERIADFKAGRLRALVNNNILTTGFDYPNIDCIVMLRPTASPGLWVQMLGRGTRPAPGKKNCLVLDFAGNTRRLGPINDPVLPRRKGKGPKGIAPVRLCEVCGCYSHASCRFCENPECGAEFPKNIKISSVASMSELIAGIIPQVHHYDVKRVVYHIHHKEGKPDSMRVDYYCGLRRFSEFICLDHSGYAARVARQWWEARSPWGVPPSVHDGMKAVDYLKIPKKISVIDKKNFPEVCGFEFD